jgi:hypothetical protein
LAAAQRPIHRGPFEAELYLWRMADREILGILRVSDGAFEQVAFSPDSTQLAALNAPGRLRLWRITLPEMRAKP